MAGAPVHVSGFDALQNESGGDNGTGVLLESVLGGFGALIVLAFVFASFLALVPIAMAIVSIMTTFLLVWGLTTFTDISPVVQFLIATRTGETPVSDVASQHRSATTCHLANIALRLGRKLTWDAGREQVVGDDEANAMLSRPQRSPYQVPAV